jgi:hypothetical protein
LILPPDGKIKDSSFDIVFEITNHGPDSVRVCTWCGQRSWGGEHYEHLVLSQFWKSDGPSDEKLAKSVVELKAGGSIKIPFGSEIVQAGSSYFFVSYQGGKSGLDAWSGTIKAPPIHFIDGKVEELSLVSLKAEEVIAARAKLERLLPKDTLLTRVEVISQDWPDYLTFTVANEDDKQPLFALTFWPRAHKIPWLFENSYNSKLCSSKTFDIFYGGKGELLKKEIKAAFCEQE